jgi:hypothetical protein
VAGSLSSDLHHARRDGGAGFCTFNGLVMAAREALTAGARSVLVLDLDAHCDGGTRSMTEEDLRIWQVDVSVNSYDAYESSDSAWLEIVKDSASYLPAIDRALSVVDRRGPRFDLCLYNAGMDRHEKCPTGGIPGAVGMRLSRSSMSSTPTRTPPKWYDTSHPGRSKGTHIKPAASARAAVPVTVPGRGLAAQAKILATSRSGSWLPRAWATVPGRKRV